jgi:hypothetical protein
LEWPQVRAEYEERAKTWPPAQELLNFIKHIETTKLARGLYGWPSMMDLCISQSPILPPMEGPHLRISPRGDGKLEFRYIDTAIETRQWHRIVHASDAIPRLEKFLQQLHWFSDL